MNEHEMSLLIEQALRDAFQVRGNDAQITRSMMNALQVICKDHNGQTKIYGVLIYPKKLVGEK